MATPPSSPPPSPKSTTPFSPSTLKKTRKATRLRSLATRPVGVEKPVVHVDPATRKADGPQKKEIKNIFADYVTYDNWKQVHVAQKDLIWEDIQAEFDIPESSNLKTKKKILQTVGEQWRQFKSDLISKWALAHGKKGEDDKVCEKYGISKEKMFERRHMPFRKKTLPLTCCLVGEAAQSGSTNTVVDPPSSIRRHVKWKMARMKETGQMTSEAAKEIAKRIVSHFHLSVVIFCDNCWISKPILFRLLTIGFLGGAGLTGKLFRPWTSKCTDYCHWAIEHLGPVRAPGAGVTIKHYFGPASRGSCTSSSMATKDLEQLTQKIRDQLEVSTTQKVTQQLMMSFSQMQS
ncbi:hypothetical protein HKD37_18G050711 [Glycine soja]